MTAARLGTRVWISAHDGDKEVKGLANGLLKTRKWTREEVSKELGFEVGLEKLDRQIRDTKHERGVEKMDTGVSRRETNGGKATEVMVLGIGEEVVLDSEGVRHPELGGRKLG